MFELWASGNERKNISRVTGHEKERDWQSFGRKMRGGSEEQDIRCNKNYYWHKKKMMGQEEEDKKYYNFSWGLPFRTSGVNVVSLPLSFSYFFVIVMKDSAHYECSVQLCSRCVIVIMIINMIESSRWNPSQNKQQTLIQWDIRNSNKLFSSKQNPRLDAISHSFSPQLNTSWWFSSWCPFPPGISSLPVNHTISGYFIRPLFSKENITWAEELM